MATACYSSSTMPTPQTKDGFGSCRSKDVCCFFVRHGDAALRQKKIQSYINRQRLIGIWGALMHAIQESKLSVIIFSKNYASTSWCLDELARILDCKKELEQLGVSVIYGVGPRVVRKQTGAYAAAFDRHEERFKHDPDKLLKWRDARTRVDQLKGWESRKYRSDFIQALTDDVLELMVSVGKKILENGTSEQSVEMATAVDDKSKDSYPIRPSQLDDDCLESILIKFTYYKDLTDDVQNLLPKDANVDSQSVKTAVDDESKDSYPDKLSQLHHNGCLEKILKKVPYYKDFVAFSEVCHSSRSVCSNMEWDEGPKPPCLMLSENSGSSSHSFFNLHNNNGFILELPAVVRRRIWGSSYGWLVTVDPELEAQLMNPISQVCINLPPFPTMHNQLSRKNQFHMIHKILVFKIKIDKFLLMVIFNPEN
ncbi:protein VARIATION IN COMPOUND TRIGGERED ROOT growth response [Morus notabilis]|uniref:protein VARIATION IN COMPOUND TRIGGERED ROOT growth response n=1 Tax=Morus notabilis TaxID=981085 RepID=UPI000CED564C|nr:protein VARIATION IN COMPOUND TRIGGERED ROOT growth response [Morus notabilis]